MRKNIFILLVIVLVLTFVVACSEPAYELTSVRDWSEENLIAIFNSMQFILLSSIETWNDNPDSVGDMISGEYSLNLAEGEFFFDITWNNFDFDKIEEGLAQSLMIFPGNFVIIDGYIKASPLEGDHIYTFEATIKLHTMFGLAYYQVEFKGFTNEEGVVDTVEYAIINGESIDPDNYLDSFKL